MLAPVEQHAGYTIASFEAMTAQKPTRAEALHEEEREKSNATKSTADEGFASSKKGRRLSAVALSQDDTLEPDDEAADEPTAPPVMSLKSAIGLTATAVKVQNTLQLPTVAWSKVELDEIISKGSMGSSIFRASYRGQTIAVRRLGHMKAKEDLLDFKKAVDCVMCDLVAGDNSEKRNKRGNGKRHRSISCCCCCC